MNQDDRQEQIKLNQLLEKVKLKHGYSLSHSKDCDHLASSISNQTGEIISGSTVKRLFGFIKTQSHPNKYTLNLLSRFAGYQDYKDFLIEQGSVLNKEDWAKITEQTHQFLKAKFIEIDAKINPKDGLDLLNKFSESDKEAIAIVGEGGNGKTQLLVQFVSEASDSKKILFIEAADLRLKCSENTLVSWMKAQDPELDLFIIDGIEETAYKFEEVRALFGQILHLLENKPQRLKIVIAVRPHTWLKLVENMQGDEIKGKWMNSISPFNDINDVCNLPLLDINLIKEKYPDAPDSLQEMIRRPLFYSIYHRIAFKGIFNEWQLLFEFFKMTIWNSAHAYEKQQFIDTILENTKFGQSANSVNRTVLEELIVRYKKAYMNLISFHIIAEQKEINKYGRFQSSFRFGHQYYFEFFILSHILEIMENDFLKSGQHIIDNYESERCISLLKLLVSYACANEMEQLSDFFELNLSEQEHRSIFPHLASLIINNSTYQKTLLPLFVNSESGRRKFIEFWVDEASLDGYYGEMIQEYAKLVNSTQDRLFAQCLLYLRAFQVNDAHACQSHFKEIENIEITDQRIHPFVIGRKCMTLLLEDFRLNKIYSAQTLKTVDSFLSLHLIENEIEQTIHFAGVEHNILHAEFLTQVYHYTPVIMETLNRNPDKKYFDSTNKMILLDLFFHAYRNSITTNKDSFNLNQEQLDSIYPCDRKLVRQYVQKVNATN